MWNKFFKIQRLRKLRSVLRGYNILKEQNNLGLISKLNIALTHTVFQDIKNDQYFHTFLFNMGGDPELAVRQFLLSRMQLSNPILFAFGKKESVTVSLPPLWIQVLSNHGLAVNRSYSVIKFYAQVLLYLGYGFYSGLRFFLLSIYRKLFKKNDHFRYIFFDSLGFGNLPSEENKSYDIVSWYLNYLGYPKDFDTVCHTVKTKKDIRLESHLVKYNESPIPNIASYKKLAFYFVWVFYASFIAFINIFLGRWWYALLFAEVGKLAQIHFSEKEALAKQYLFHNSGWIYRPLWTYEAEKKGSEIIFYFYSTNCENFKRVNEYPPLNYGWETMSWSRYLVWDKYQADFVKRAVGSEVKIDVVGIINFHSGNSILPTLPKEGLVAVFDVQPMRSSFYKTLGIDLEYYIPEIANQFLSDITEVTSRNGSILHKRKREVGKIAHPKYRNFMRLMETSPNYILIDPNLSASRLIEKSDMVISMPFTSTALIAREFGKPSIYYDPSGIIQKDDRAAHGIPIVVGKLELRAWVEKNLENKGRK